jgi:hypothetical protein
MRLLYGIAGRWPFYMAFQADGWGGIVKPAVKIAFSADRQSVITSSFR